MTLLFKAPSMAPTTKPDRLPITRRAKTAPPFVLTKRDVEILTTLANWGQLSADQIQRLYFPSPEACRPRLRGLYHNGYVDRREQPQVLTDGRKPLVYFLDTLGAHTLTDLGVTHAWKKPDNRLSPHVLSINEVRTAATVSARMNGWTIEEWIDERTIRRHNLIVSPDGYFRLVVPLDRERVYHGVLECDRGTETLKTFAAKVGAYDTLYNSGKYREVFGASAIRVLVVAPSHERMMNLKTAVEAAGGQKRYFFTTYDALRTGDMFTDPVWYLGGMQYPDRFFTP